GKEHLTIRYTPPSPHSLILTPSIMQSYEEIFRFLVLLIQTESSLKRVIRSSWWRNVRYGGRNWRSSGRRGRTAQNDYFEESLYGVEEWDPEETKAGLRLLRFGRGFVGGVMRYVFETGVGEVWEGFREALDLVAVRIRDGDGQGKSKVRGEVETEVEKIAKSVTDLEGLYRTHVGVVDEMRRRVLVGRQMEPVRKIVEGLCEICGEFERVVRVRCGELPKGGLRSGTGGGVGDLCARFEQGMGMLVKVLVGLEERDEQGNECWGKMRDAVDGNGFWERRGVSVL
ncbi:hypothetical protein HK097_003152, partial [Rhizophlyctis rosea]